MTEPLKRAAVFCFLSGSLEIKTEGYGDANGSGRFVFQDDDLDWSDDGEDAVRILHMPKSELLELRDQLNEMLGPLACCANNRPQFLPTEDDEFNGP